MNRRSIVFFACTLALVVVTSAAAQQIIAGTVARVDPSANVIVLADGRMFQTTGEIVVNNQRMPLSALQPGTRVTLREARPVTLQSGRYVVVAEPAPTSVVVSPPPVVTSPPVAVAPPPPPVVVTPQPVVVRQDPIVGTVARVDAAESEIVLTDHRIVKITPNDVVLVNNVPMPLGSVPIGSTVAIRSDTPFSALPGRDQSRDLSGAKEQSP